MGKQVPKSTTWQPKLKLKWTRWYKVLIKATKCVYIESNVRCHLESQKEHGARLLSKDNSACIGKMCQSMIYKQLATVSEGVIKPMIENIVSIGP